MVTSFVPVRGSPYRKRDRKPTDFYNSIPAYDKIRRNNCRCHVKTIRLTAVLRNYCKFKQKKKK